MRRFEVIIHGINKQNWRLDFSEELFDKFLQEMEQKWVNITDTKRIRNGNYEERSVHINTEAISYYTVCPYNDSL